VNIRSVVKVLGFLMLVTAGCLVLPALVSLLYQEGDWVWYLVSAGIGALVGGGTLLLLRDAPDVRVREGFAVVGFGWLCIGLLGAVPLWLSGQIPSFTDAAFESISGFTTTGATILTDIEGRSHGTLFWRALSHWLGGMGIVLLAVAILPLLGVGGMQLYRAEVPGPVAERLTPRIRETAKRLWGVYILLTALEVAALMVAGMGPFDSICHSFATMATGGFSNHNASVGGYASPAVEWIIILFMFLAGANFSLHYLALTGRWMVYVRDEEFRFYLSIVGVGTAVIGGVVLANHFYPHWHDVLRHSMFQVVSILTTTGFGTRDYLLWPPVAHAILLILMTVGGCAGSTGGGIKVIRFLLLIKQGLREITRLIHPNAQIPVRMGRKSVNHRVVDAVWGFFSLYVASFTFMYLALAATGLDLMTAFSAVAACINNLGPGLGNVGANYASLHDPAKWILCFAMLLGRLEIFTLLVLLTPAFWRR